MTSIFEFQANKIERIAAALAHFVATTPTDKLDWCPATDANSHTHSILAMVAECVQINCYTAALLRGETPEAPPADGAIPADLSTAEGAQQHLIASGHELATAVAALDESALTRPYPHWRGPIVGAVLIESPYRNMAYHAGQVNLIQLLAGDTEFHLPPTWLNP